MTITVSDYIPKEKFEQFHEILCATGGRYKGNPYDAGSRVYVVYEAGDYVAQCEAWNRCLQGVNEVQSTQWWKRVVRRVKLALTFWN